MKRLILILAVLCLLLVSCGGDTVGSTNNSQSTQSSQAMGGSLPDTQNKNDTPGEIQEMIDFYMQDWESNEVKLSDLNDKPIVLNFWASWCSPCKAELPDFERAYKEYGDSVNFVMLVLTSENETVEKAKAHITEKGYTFPVYFDVKLQARAYYKVESIPRTYFIDKNGKILYNVNQMITSSQLEKGLELITK